MITGVRGRGARTRSTMFGYANLVPFVFFALFPFYFMVITSFKSNAELYKLKSVPFVVKAPIVDHYTFLFARTDFFSCGFLHLDDGSGNWRRNFVIGVQR